MKHFLLHGLRGDTFSNGWFSIFMLVFGVCHCVSIPGVSGGPGMSLMKCLEIMIAPPKSKMEGKCFGWFCRGCLFWPFEKLMEDLKTVGELLDPS